MPHISLQKVLSGGLLAFALSFCTTLLLPPSGNAQTTEPELEIWPGPARAGALAAPILSVSPSFTTIPNPDSAIINGVTFWMPIGSIIRSSSTGFLQLDSGRNWVPFSATGDISGIIASSTSVISNMVKYSTDIRDITRVVFASSRSTFTHYFPLNRRVRPHNWLALTIGGAPYQESAHILSTSGGLHLGITVQLEAGSTWSTGQVAEGEFWTREQSAWVAPPNSFIISQAYDGFFKVLGTRGW